MLRATQWRKMTFATPTKAIAAARSARPPASKCPAIPLLEANNHAARPVSRRPVPPLLQRSVLSTDFPRAHMLHQTRRVSSLRASQGEVVTKTTCRTPTASATARAFVCESPRVENMKRRWSSHRLGVMSRRCWPALRATAWLFGKWALFLAASSGRTA